MIPSMSALRPSGEPSFSATIALAVSWRSSRNPLSNLATE